MIWRDAKLRLSALLAPPRSPNQKTHPTATVESSGPHPSAMGPLYTGGWCTAHEFSHPSEFKSPTLRRVAFLISGC